MRWWPVGTVSLLCSTPLTAQTSSAPADGTLLRRDPYVLPAFAQADTSRLFM